MRCEVDDGAAEFLRHETSVTERVIRLEAHKAAAIGFHCPYQFAKRRGL
jgi:hypothetical protein